MEEAHHRDSHVRATDLSETVKAETFAVLTDSLPVLMSPPSHNPSLSSSPEHQVPVSASRFSQGRNAVNQ